jgi:hypothetical protein
MIKPGTVWPSTTRLEGKTMIGKRSYVHVLLKEDGSMEHQYDCGCSNCELRRKQAAESFQGEFDPEKVERHDFTGSKRPSDWVVMASDYDRLLALYREAIARRDVS